MRQPAHALIKVSELTRVDSACRQFAQHHNLAKLAERAGIKVQTLRNKLNPDQPHELTLSQLVALTKVTNDPTILDGLLAQLKCLPAVPVTAASPGSLPAHTLSAAAAVGAIAGEATSNAPLTAARKNAILSRANQAIRDLSLIVVAVETRFQSTPMLAAAVDIFNACAPTFAIS